MHQDQDCNAALALGVQWGEAGDVVSLTGDFDYLAAPRVTTGINGLLALGRRRIVINLDAVTFIDGAAVGALIWADEHARQVGGSLRVTRLPGCVRLLQITGEIDKLSFEQSTQRSPSLSEG